MVRGFRRAWARIRYPSAVALSFLQKLRLSLRIWLRRREEAADRRRRDFVAREAGWRPATSSEGLRPRSDHPIDRFDLEGIQLAWLDDSGAFVHFLDLQAHDVVDLSSGDLHAIAALDGDSRFRRIPTRSAESDDEDRRLFIETRVGSIRLRLATALTAADPATEFRRVLAGDRDAERAWFAFRNERSLETIETWLRSVIEAR